MGQFAPPRPVTPHGIVAAMLRDLAHRAERFEDRDFARELASAAELAGGLEPYTEQCTTAPSPALAQLAQRTREEPWLDRSSAGTTEVALEQEMLSGHVEGQFLKILVHATRARRILEIGLFTGYSALAMAEALPADGLLIACELDPFAADFARSALAASPDGAKVRIEVGPAANTLIALADRAETFDLIFIDADKGGYADYLDRILSGGLLAAHGLVCVDNTLMQGQPWRSTRPTENGQAIAEFNRRIAADPRVEQVLLPLRDGVTLIRRVGG